MKKKPVQIVPLTSAEKECLIGLYRKGNRAQSFGRYVLKFISIFFGFLVLTGLTAMVHDVFFYDGLSRFTTHFFLSYMELKLMAVILLMISARVLDYFGSLRYKQDALSGVKQMVSFTVDSKEYYEVTDQYFVRFKGDADMMFEVSESAFNSCEEGGTILLGKAIKSGRIFCENNNIIYSPIHGGERKGGGWV